MLTCRDHTHGPRSYEQLLSAATTSTWRLVYEGEEKRLHQLLKELHCFFVLSSATNLSKNKEFQLFTISLASSFSIHISRQISPAKVQ